MITAQLTLVGQYNPDVAANIIRNEAISMLRYYESNAKPYETECTAVIAQRFGIVTSIPQDRRSLCVIHITLTYYVAEPFVDEVRTLIWGRLSGMYRNALYQGHERFTEAT